MKPLYVCVATLNRYDLLHRFLLSVKESHRRPDMTIVVDNGMSREKILEATSNTLEVAIYTPAKPMGVAEFWNFFIKHTSDERVICNDDIVLAPESLDRIVATPGDFVSPLASSWNAFSCFLLRDSCIEKVGMFDETISPGYAYFEDCDYAQRMYDLGMDITSVECNVVHDKSSTLAQFTPEQMTEHRRKFLIAQSNYVRKHGSMPHGREMQS